MQSPRKVTQIDAESGAFGRPIHGEAPSIGMANVAAVVLTYNSDEDLPACLDGLRRQVGVALRVIVVDNASDPERRERMVEAFREKMPGGVVLGVAEATPERLRGCPAVFVANDRNSGYSAGNNIGARLAVALSCEAVLIVNPDVQIDDPHYLFALVEGLRADDRCFVAASRIVGLSGQDENPLREPGFWEELLWLRRLGPKAFRPKPFTVELKGDAPVQAEKVHGCCLLFRASFLEEMGYLDENVFLYCEEPILAASVRRLGGRLVVFPRVRAVHAHVAGKKGNPSRRMLQFIVSRLYYIDRYSGYGPFRRAALHASYALLYALHAARARMSAA